MENKNDLTIVNEVTGEVIDTKEAINLDMGEEIARVQIRAKTINKEDSKESFKVFKASAQFMLYKNKNEVSELVKKYLYKNVSELSKEELEQLNKDIDEYNKKDNFYLVSDEPVSLWVDCKFIKEVEFSRDCLVNNVQKLKTGEIAVKVKNIDLSLNYKPTLIINDKCILEFNYPTMWVKAVEGFKPFYSAMPNRFGFKPKQRVEEAETEETTE